MGLWRATARIAIWSLVASSVAMGVSTETQVNLLVTGDWGFVPGATRPSGQQKTAAAMAEYVRRNRTGFDAVLVGGDSFKVKLSGPDDPQFRQGFEEMYDPKALDMPFYAVFGNHDYEYHAAAVELEYSRRHSDSRWKAPDPWYRLDLPAGNCLVTILMLNSNRAELGKEAWEAQLAWMDAELSREPKPVWTLCLGHHPLFSDGRHGDDAAMQSAWGPILRKHKVDFYFSGHDHVLQHLEMPGWPTTFVTSGGGGEDTKRPVNARRGPFVRTVHGFAALRFNARSATVSLIDDTGTVLHEFERDRTAGIRILNTTPSDKPPSNTGSS